MKKQNLLTLINYFQLKPSEFQIYKLLMKKPMTINDIKKRTHFSERTIRYSLDNLINKNFLFKKALLTNRMKYLYYTNSENTIWETIMKKIRR